MLLSAGFGIAGPWTEHASAFGQHQTSWYSFWTGVSAADMPVAARKIRLVLMALVALIAVGATSLLAFRAYRQHVTADAIAIRSAKGIDEAMYVPIGGIDQWIEIRGDDRDNPLLLCMH